MSAYPHQAYRGDDPFIFVSYAHDDADDVYDEIAALTEAGYRVYYDEGIHPGHTWHDDLAAAIERCTLFLIFVSESSIASRNCMRELTFALDRECEVLAVHLAKVELPPGAQLALGDRQGIFKHKFSPADYRARLLAALRGYLTPAEVRDGTESNDEVEARASADKRANPRSNPERSGARWTRAVLPVIVAAILVAAWLGWRELQARSEANALQEQARRDFVAAAQADEVFTAFRLERQLSHEYRESDEFQRLWNSVTSDVSLMVASEGAMVEFRPYGQESDPGSSWRDMGEAPIDGLVTLPTGTVEMRVSKPGFVTGRYAVQVPGPLAVEPGYEFFATPVTIELDPTGTIPDDMVRVPATDMPIWVARMAASARGGHQHAMPTFAVARREVSNADYQAFVDAGGYDEPSFWAGFDYRSKGSELSEADARAAFVDQTGEPGPAGWSLGRYPSGDGDLPVTGISWFEAMAYLRYEGRTMPTVHHWARFALGPYEGFARTTPSVSAASNFNQRDALSVHAERGLGPWGTYDAAGNVREWLYNASGDDALAGGASYVDYPTDADTLLRLDPMTRNAFVGVRGLMLLEPEPVPPELLAPVPLVMDDALAARTPYSDEAYEVLRYQFTADNRKHVGVEIEEIQRGDGWSIEEHVLAYDDDSRFRLYLMKPTRVRDRYQTVVYAPHGGAFVPGQTRDSVAFLLGHAEKAVRSGRLVVMPEWHDTITRWVPPAKDPSRNRNGPRLAALAWYQDTVDTLNYLDQLPMAATDEVVFMAESYGSSVFGVMLLALQPRFSGALIIGAGLIQQEIPPVLDSVHYAPRVTQPVLMINGIHDPVFPHEESQLPLYELLGTSETDKRMKTFEAGHYRYPEAALSREIASWLNEQLGSVD